MGHNKAAVIGGVPRGLHAADAQVAYCYCLQVCHLILWKQPRDVFRFKSASQDLDIWSLFKPETVASHVVCMLVRREDVGELGAV